VFDGRFRAGVDVAVKPLGAALRWTGLSPDHLTAFGLVLGFPTAWAIATGRLGLGLGLLIGSAVPDLLDGALAKAAGRSTVRGAFFDSVCDRVTDALVLGGIAWYLQDRHHGHAFMLPFAVLGLSLLISYERAKAESLHYDAKGGLMERAERIIVLCVGLAWSVLLVPLLWVMVVLTSVTAVQRFVKVWRQASVDVPPPPPRPTRAPRPRVTAAGVPPAPVAERWRAWREANGLSPREGRPARRGDRSAASVRWAERRRTRLEKRAAAGGERLRRRSSSRRP
jgi:CDP-diacylglycerol--glycerol-3-phosphate 3-phosphatidyltransferase